jgi:sec-independent protein translocase protein TatC
VALVPFPNKSPAAIPDDDLDDRSDYEIEAEGAPSAEGARMSFLDHLDELRRRIMYALGSALVGFVIVVWYVFDIFAFIFRPMQAMLPAGQTLIYTDPAEQFMLLVKIAVLAGLLLASPLVILQVWLFIAPGLYANEKKWAIPFVLMATFFCLVGAAFSHYVVFPITWNFFVSFSVSDFIEFQPRVEPAFSLYLRLVLACAVTFQLPTVVLFLAGMGMAIAGFMIRNFKYAFLIIVLAAAVLSPDGGGVGMVAMGGPVLILYIFSIGLAWLFAKKKKPIEA